MALNSSFVQVQNLTLAGSGCGSTDSSIVLNSFALPNGVLVVMSNFGAIGYATLEPGTSREENISFTGITQNTDGTATVTGVTRGLSFVSPYTAVSINQIQHGGGSIAVISNSAPFYGNLDSNENDESPTGLWTFTQIPVVSPAVTPTSPLQLTPKAYVDSVVGGIAVTNAVIVGGTSGATLTKGQVVYLKSADGKWYVADSSATATSVAVELGIAQSSVSSGLAVNILIGGLDSTQTGLTAGAVYYLSTTGAISTTKGANIRLVGQVPNGSTTTIVTDFTGGNPELALVDGSRSYAVDIGSANAYVITLVPVIAAYKAGQVFTFKATNANTTTSTLAINGLTATTIKSSLGGNLVANDILAGQLVQVTYDGTNFQMTSPLGNQTAIALKSATTVVSVSAATAPSPNQVLTATDSTHATWVTPATSFKGLYGHGSTTYDISTASGTQNIAHGLGAIPTGFRVFGACTQNIGSFAQTFSGNSVSMGGNTTLSASATFRFFDGTNFTTAVITVDITNIILTWTKSGSPTGTAQIIWEAFA